MDQTADLVLKELITLHEDASMSKDVEKNGGIIAAIDISLPCLPPSVQNLFFKNAYIMRIRIRRGLFSWQIVTLRVEDAEGTGERDTGQG